MVLKKYAEAIGGSATVTLTTGDGSTNITHSLGHTNYVVLLTLNGALTGATAVTLYITNKTSTGFTINVLSDTTDTSATIDYAIVPIKSL